LLQEPQFTVGPMFPEGLRSNDLLIPGAEPSLEV